MEGRWRILDRGGRLVGAVRGGASTIGRALYPHTCVVCGVEEEILCRLHANEARRSLGDVFSCPACGEDAEGGRTCEPCASPLDALWSMGKYARSPAGTLLRAWKYEGIESAKDAFLDAVRNHVRQDERVKRYIDGATLVPVPCDTLRRAVRGIDQSEVLAAVIAEATGKGRVRHLLRRNGFRKAQASLADTAARTQNAEGAFSLKTGERAPLDMVLIDDVCTSGATLAACARVLRRAGAERVRALTVMRG